MPTLDKSSQAYTLLRNLANRIGAILAFLLLWETISRTGIVDSSFLPPFSEVAVAFVNLLLSGELVKQTAVSLQRAALGFGLAMLVSIPLGLMMGWFKWFERFTDPLVQTLRNVPSLALLPIFILFLGIGEESKIAIIFWGSLWATLLNTINGVKSVDPILIKSARSMSASNTMLFSKVILPSAVPSIFTGMRLSATHSILILIAAEMIGASAGLGYLILSAEYSFNIKNMYVGIITLALLGITVNYILLNLESRATKWKEAVIRE
ncbi:ABC transporter permease [Methanosphaerula subterraneus]|uniref:ABC transporter permease n=1 Tax=Methanosphaerula subterraneus TaxID=3350244 RepID=UPI003F82A39E